jgi:DNA (cytosine-5)-methyltransferase 1
VFDHCEGQQLRAIDLFSGVGGSSWGARLAGAELVGAFDAWELAGRVYRDNFPDTEFFHGRLEDMNLNAIKRKLGNIDLMLASPECTNHGPAKGNRPRCDVSKNTAFQVTRFAEALKPRWIVIENVSSMRKWDRYQELIDDLTVLGYQTHPQVLNSADFGVPQRRRRLFLVCDLLKKPLPIPIPRVVPKSAREILDLSDTYKLTPLRSPRRAKATLERADRAIACLGNSTPFLLVYYGSDHAGGWQSLDAPLRTVTTLDRFALVLPTPTGHVMRMLQVPELKAAMGMPVKFEIGHGCRRERLRLVGNAVCPPVMRAAVRSLMQTEQTLTADLKPITGGLHVASL